MTRLAQSLRESAAAVADLDESAGSVSALDPHQLIAATRAIAELRRHTDQFAARVASEVDRRSGRELGNQGLAQKAGFVSSVAMIQSVAQVSRHEATRLIEMGALLADVERSSSESNEAGGVIGDVVPDGVNEAASVAAPEWHRLLAGALAEGRMSLEKVDAIRRVMADITPARDTAAAEGTTLAGDTAPVGDTRLVCTEITAAVGELIGSATLSSPEQLYRAAKRARDLIDSDGIDRREKQQRDLRSVRTWWDGAGMHCGSWRLPPQEGTLVADAFDQILSPRRGGPRFVDPAEKKTGEELLNDPRTDEQMAADAFVDMIRLAADADPGTLFGTRRPAVRVIITADRLTDRGTSNGINKGNDGSGGSGNGTGSGTVTSIGTVTSTGANAAPRHGYLEGRHDTVSAATIDRYVCDTGTVSIGFDTDGTCVNVGRDHRLFTARQRVGLAIRDGGCRFPGCERPPSYSEAHHINPWKAKRGRTDINDGILLCRRHHHLIHTNHWDIVRTRAGYHLQPPIDIDPHREQIFMPSRSPAMDDFRREQQMA